MEKIYINQKKGMYVYMEPNRMKNMVILKNLPSNIVEEAYIVLKDNGKIHKEQKVEKNQKGQKIERPKTKEYMIKEAEMVIQDYITNIEKKQYEMANGNKKMKEKYKRLKALTIFLFFFSALSLFAMLLK